VWRECFNLYWSDSSENWTHLYILPSLSMLGGNEMTVEEWDKTEKDLKNIAEFEFNKHTEKTFAKALLLIMEKVRFQL